jgi:hypothetical protein
VNNTIAQLRALVEEARHSAHRKVSDAVATGGFTRDAYVRFLSNQYHLTKGVQRPLLRIAASDRLTRRRQLREFLFKFALEEEPHYLMAQRDLEALGVKDCAKPLEAALWWAYFDSIMESQPLQRLGGTCILENIGVGLGAVIRPLFKTLDFIRPETTRFLMVHLHEEIPHGDEVLRVVDAAKLDANDYGELIVGARVAATLYLRMIDWYFDPRVSLDSVAQ